MAAALVAVALIAVAAPARAWAGTWDAVFLEGNIWNGTIITSGSDLTWENDQGVDAPGVLLTTDESAYYASKFISVYFPGHTVISDQYVQYDKYLTDIVTGQQNISKVHLYDSYGQEVSEAIASHWQNYSTNLDGFSIRCNNLDPDEEYTIIIDAGMEDIDSGSVASNGFSFTFTVGGLKDRGDTPGSDDRDSGDDSDDEGSDTGGAGGGQNGGDGSGSGAQSGSGTGGNGTSTGGDSTGDVSGGQGAAGAIQSASGAAEGNAARLSTASTNRETAQVSNLAQRAEGSATLHKISGGALSQTLATSDSGAEGGGGTAGGVDFGQSETGFLWLLALVAIAVLVFGVVRQQLGYRYHLRGAAHLE